MNTITPIELFDLQGKSKVELIDVRTPAEFREVHADGARIEPLDRLQPQRVMAARNGLSDEPLYVICLSGSRSRQACEKFIAAGYSNVVSVDGGTRAWEQSGLPVHRGKKSVSLERQVRIASGLLVLAGAVLGFFVHPYFIALSAFVGAGLVFAGVSDTCGMAMILAKMPWNQLTVAADSTAEIQHKHANLT
jgi:rhodanese-related sulfurtransferase